MTEQYTIRGGNPSTLTGGDPLFLSGVGKPFYPECADLDFVTAFSSVVHALENNSGNHSFWKQFCVRIHKMATQIFG